MSADGAQLPVLDCRRAHPAQHVMSSRIPILWDRRRSGAAVLTLWLNFLSALMHFGCGLLGKQALRLLIALACFLRGLHRRLASFG
ncbi:MAG TPA: hypothetical protein VNU00_09465 [Candidatus Binataceae bacterium]|nr:hypothetical protein [Candidatus Binataceae bacterium]